MRLRMALGLLGWSTILIVLGACTSSIAGTPTFGGPTQTTEDATEESTESTEETTEETSNQDTDEFIACLTVPFLYDTANNNFVALADATTAGTPTDLTTESVAADFDAAVIAVQSYLDPLPAGAVRDSVQAAQTAASGLRDGLRAGSAVDNIALNAALDSFATSCDF